jgi:two-component system sensor histidine kinase AlgZ
MSSSPALPAPVSLHATVRRVLRIVAANVIAWLVLSALGAVTSLNDDLRYGRDADYRYIFLAWLQSSMVLAVQSLLLYALFTWRPKLIASGARIAMGYAAMLALLMPLQMLFLLKKFSGGEGSWLSWDRVSQSVERIDSFADLIKFTSTTAVYFAVVGLKTWQLSQARHREAEQARAHGEQLRLELERQQALALRAQLEPHFMFNALNAISALVRAGEKDVALDGIHGLSQLLRYALAAGDRHWATLAEEMAFIEQYLALQRLRYGARLQFRVEGLDADLLSSELPPLLLQPLVENAIRHDLDCHEHASDIAMRFAREGEQLHIEISNPTHAGHAANPGAGLGLRTTAARLRSAYGEKASLSTRLAVGRFILALHFPQYGAE